MKGKNISPVSAEVEVAGVKRRVLFNHTTIRYLEDVYEDIYQRDVSIQDIMRDLDRGKYRALEAVFFAGFRTADPSLTWDDIGEILETMGNEAISTLGPAMTAKFGEIFPDAEPNSKNK